MGEFIALVFVIWLVWSLLKKITKGSNSHSSKVDYRNQDPIKRGSDDKGDSSLKSFRQYNEPAKVDLITGPEAIKRLVDWNKTVMKGIYSDEYISSIDDLDELSLTNLFIRNCVEAHMAVFKEEWDGDIQELNLCAYYVMFSRFERNILNALGVDANDVMPHRAQLVYDHIVFYLTGKDSDTCKELNEMWGVYYRQTVAEMYGGT